MTFEERQKFNVGWVWGVMVLGLAITIGSILTSLLLTPAPVLAEWIGGTIGIVVMIGLLIMMATMTLRTRIDEYGVEASIKPFVNRKYFWREIESVSIDDHDNLHFGYKRNPLTKTDYLTLNRGKVIVVRLRNGRTVRIGTQQPAEIDAFLRELFDTETEYATPIESDLLEELQRIRLAQRR
jgi:hypothetical protein